MRVIFPHTDDVRETTHTQNKPNSRKKLIVGSLERFCPIENNNSHDVTNILKMVHSDEMINYLKNAHRQFMLAGCSKDYSLDGNGLIPSSFITSDAEKNKIIKQFNDDIWKLAGLFCTDYVTPIYSDTFKGIESNINTLMTATEMIEENDIIYCVLSNPGHHAGYDFYGGFCFVNNACVLAKISRFNKITILDVDYHAGDGTNNIINRWGNPNIKSVSLHIDPREDYPGLRGFEFENNEYVTNIIFPKQCSPDVYFEKLDETLKHVNDPDLLILSFGADTYKNDPETVAKCLLDKDDYFIVGKKIRDAVSGKIIIVQEGGYDLSSVSDIVNNLLDGIHSKNNNKVR